MNNLTDLYLCKSSNYKPMREFKKILPGVKFIRGPYSDQLLAKETLKMIYRMPIIKQIMGEAKKHIFLSSAYKKSLKNTRNKLKDVMGVQGDGRVVINRGYINREDIGPVARRKILMHEKFHTKPIIGSSELLAHLYGGFVGPKKHKLKHVLREYDRLWHTRPIRSGLEHGAVVGAGLLGKKLLTHKKDDNA